MRINVKRMLWLAAAAAVLLTVSLALASGELLPRSLVGSGGGGVSQGQTTLQSAIGQPLVGAVQSGELTLCSGYLCTAEAPPLSGTESDYNLYLPLTVRQ